MPHHMCAASEPVPSFFQQVPLILCGASWILPLNAHDAVYDAARQTSPNRSLDALRECSICSTETNNFCDLTRLSSHCTQ